MGLGLRHTSLDDYFHEQDRKVIVNHLSPYTDLDITESLYTSYGETISLIPQCECGKTTSGWHLGQICSYCHTEVVERFKDIKPTLWIEKYEEDLKFLSPHFWGQLKQLLSNNTKIDHVRYLCDTGYNPRNIKELALNLASIIGGRGYSNFINNLPKVFTYLKSVPTFKVSDKYRRLLLLEKLYMKDKDTVLYSDYLPIINKRLFVMEHTNKGSFTTALLSDAINIPLTAITLTKYKNNRKRLENGTARIISGMSSLFDEFMKENVSGKKGLGRRHIYGTRIMFTFRAVIVSLNLKFDYDTLHVPWVVGVTALRPHLLNKLWKRGFTQVEADGILSAAVMKYDPLIDELLKELIEESPHKGIPTSFLRNPSLHMGSWQRFFITRFKTQPEDKTISISPLVIKAPNGDYDGLL